MIPPLTIFHFQKESTLQNWAVVNDVVMGGRSTADFALNKAGHAVFSGTVSLENNGGFASVRYRFPAEAIQGYTKAIIKLKGDGKRYQFRVKANANDRHSYITYFQTTGEWQTLDISLLELYPTFRGKRLDMPNFAAEKLTEIAFLIGNKADESFRLELELLRLE